MSYIVTRCDSCVLYSLDRAPVAGAAGAGWGLARRARIRCTGGKRRASGRASRGANGATAQRRTPLGSRSPTPLVGGGHTAVRCHCAGAPETRLVPPRAGRADPARTLECGHAAKRSSFSVWAARTVRPEGSAAPTARASPRSDALPRTSSPARRPPPLRPMRGRTWRAKGFRARPPGAARNRRREGQRWQGLLRRKGSSWGLERIGGKRGQPGQSCDSGIRSCTYHAKSSEARNVR